MWTDGYIGLPFEPNGRGRTGLDCWGLIVLVYRERLGIELFDYDGVFKDRSDATLRRISKTMERERAAWLKVDSPRDCDVALMSRAVGGIPVHVGLYVDGGALLHVSETSDSVLEPLSRSAWTNRILGYYRHA